MQYYIRYFIFAYLIFSFNAFAVFQEYILGNDEETVFLVTKEKDSEKEVSRKETLKLSAHGLEAGKYGFSFQSVKEAFVVHNRESSTGFIFIEKPDGGFRKIEMDLAAGAATGETTGVVIDIQSWGEIILVYESHSSNEAHVFTKKTDGSYEYIVVAKDEEVSVLAIRPEPQGEIIVGGGAFSVWGFNSSQVHYFIKNVGGGYQHIEVKKDCDQDMPKMDSTKGAFIVYGLPDVHFFIQNTDFDRSWCHQKIENGQELNLEGAGEVSIEPAEGGTFNISKGSTKYQLKNGCVQAIAM